MFESYVKINQNSLNEEGVVREAIESFINYLTVEKGFSGNTTAAYRNDLNQMANFALLEWPDNLDYYKPLFYLDVLWLAILGAALIIIS